MVLSPEDPLTRVTISSDSGPLMLFDGRNKAQNGWFVVRTLIPSGATQNAVVWHIHPYLVSGWTRPPVVAYNQVGYTPQRTKVAVIELDPLFDAPKTARVLRLASDGEYREAFRGEIKPWGKWLRYQYARFDFSSLHEPGIYDMLATSMRPSESRTTSIASMSGRPRLILTYRFRWITLKSAKAIASGMALRISTTPGKRP